MKKLFTLLLILYSLAFTSKAQTKLEPEVQAMITNFFTKYPTSANSAVAYIFGTNPLFTDESTEEIKGKLTKDAETMGAYYGYEPLAIKRPAPSLLMYTCMVKHDLKPLRFNFVFYRANDKWKLQAFLYNDNLLEELKHSVELK